MDTLTKALETINRPDVKFALSLVGGFLIKRMAVIESRAIPLVLQVVNLLVTFLAVAFGVTFQPGITHALGLDVGTVVSAGIFSGLKLGPVLDALATVALASGTQSQLKNVLQWLQAGATLIKKK